ncbi:MAG: hypothetical protein FGM32_11040 [Candidatus Kapabacteria bacterium]|nr:hypothetical protein [Candidatus Kapabacteria bacterium]
MIRSMRPYRHAWTIVMAVLMLVGAAIDLQAQGQKVPMRLSFQGLLLRKDGTLYQDGTFNITAELYDDEVAGNRVYVTTMPVVVVKGVFGMILGEIDPLDDVDFTKQLWLDIKAPDALPFSKRTQLTSAPYAMVAQSAVVAGGLAPDASGAVLSLNRLQGNLNLKAGSGITIAEDANANEIVIDASNLLNMIDLVSLDTAVVGINRKLVKDSKTGEDKTVIEVFLKDTSLTNKYLSRTGASAGPTVVSYDKDWINIPQYTIDRDGRITSVSTVRVPRRPDNLRPNRVVISSPTGTMTESDSLADRQVVMGRTGGAPRVTTITAGSGIKVEQNANDQLVISSDIGSQIPPIASGRFTNQTTAYVYETPDFDITTAQPVAFPDLKPTARIIVTMESETSTTAYSVTNRTGKSFRVKFAGGLPPGASINWMVLNL